MKNNYISFIGTSKITEHHIKAAKKCGFKILSISSTRKDSKFLKKIAKKHKINKFFFSYKECIKYSNQIKNLSYVITCKLSDNKKVLYEILKYKKKLLIEKPIFTNHKNFKKLLKYHNYIFVGYNRIFYDVIKKIKQNIKYNKVSNVVCTAPEISRKFITINSCHIISIIQYIFGNLKIKNVRSFQNFINVNISGKKSEIHIFFNFKASENFEIKIFNDNKLFKLSPIEKLTIYKGFNINYNNGNRSYIPKVIFKAKEGNKIFKKGFVNQYNAYKLFLEKNINPTDIFFARKIVDICEKINSKNYLL